MKNISKYCLAITILALAGCLPDTSGINPPGDQLIYPTGLALIDEGTSGQDRYLAVVNSNFDLRYNSGTMNAVNLTTLYDIIDQLNSSDLDSAYWADKSDWLSDDGSEIYIPEDLLIDKKDTLRIGSFASDLTLTPSGERAIVPVRGEKAIFVMDINRDDPTAPLFQCGQDDNKRCNGDHKVMSNDNVALPLEPYEVSTLAYGNYTLGFATHPYDGDVSLFIIDENGVTRPELLTVASSVAFGVSGIAVRPNPDNYMYSDIYVAGRAEKFQQIFVMRVLSDGENGSITNPYFNDVGSIPLYNDLFQFQDARGLAVTHAGTHGYLINRYPESLVKIDLDNQAVIDMVSLSYGSQPSIVSLYEDLGDPEDPDDDITFAFVLCFQRSQLFVLETDVMLQPHVLNTGNGPNAITFDYAAKKALVANFTESTISLIDVDTEARRFNFAMVQPKGSDIVARVKIGKPRLPQGHN